jgi:hypothetical protein
LARGSSGDQAVLVFHTAYLTLPQVLVWILDRDARRVWQIPENMVVTTLAIQHVHRWVDVASETTPIPPDIDLSRLIEIVPEEAPLKDNKLRAYLTQRGVGPDQLRGLKPETLASFGSALLHYLASWHAQAGKSKDDAEILAHRDLCELDEWLAKKGVQVRLDDLAKQQNARLLAGNALAKKTWDDALAGVLTALGNGRCKATGRRNGSGDPESIAPHYWPHLTFSDRDFEGRGLLTCACFKDDPKGDRWTDLRFDAEDVLIVWPLTTIQKQAESHAENGTAEPKADRARARPAHRASQREAVECAIAALWPNGSPMGSVKTITAAINVWLKEQNASQVSEDTVSRVLRSQRGV